MIKMKYLLSEGILDGLNASFIIDSGITESTVSGRKGSLPLPRYSVWGFQSQGNGTPKLMENGNDLNRLMEKHDIDTDDVYDMDNTIQETIKKVGKDKWAVYPKKGGRRLGTHDNKDQAKNQLAAIEVNKSKKENKSPKKSING